MVLLAGARPIPPTGTCTPLLTVDTFTDPPDELVNPTTTQVSDVLSGDTSRTSIVPPGRILVKQCPSAVARWPATRLGIARVGVAPDVPTTAARGRPRDVPGVLWNRSWATAPLGDTSKVTWPSWP